MRPMNQMTPVAVGRLAGPTPARTSTLGFGWLLSDHPEHAGEGARMSSEFCPKCGTHRAGAFRFCPKCGLDFDAEAVSSEGLAEPIYDPAPNPATAVWPSDAAPATASAVVPLPATGSSRRGWFVLGGVIFIAVVAAAAFIAATNSGLLTPHHTVGGSFVLTDTSSSSSSIQNSSSGCHGIGGYSDMGPGTGATLKDGEGKILATSTLGSGTGTPTTCTFTFTFSNVPEAAFYSFEVGHRGGLTYSLQDMKDRGWTLGATLGS